MLWFIRNESVVYWVILLLSSCIFIECRFESNCLEYQKSLSQAQGAFIRSIVSYFPPEGKFWTTNVLYWCGNVDSTCQEKGNSPWTTLTVHLSLEPPVVAAKIIFFSPSPSFPPCLLPFLFLFKIFLTSFPNLLRCN